jgi:tetratricopeptide (TPR) repeat protein
MRIDKLLIIMLILLISALVSAVTSSYNNTGVEYLQKGDFISAVLYLEQAYREDPNAEVVKKNLAIAYNNYGVSLLKENKATLALEKFGKARELYPDDDGFRANAAKSYNQLAVKALEEKNFIVSENYFYSALRLQPDETAIRKNLSVCLTNYGVEYYDKKQYDIAAGKLIDAISFDETNSNAYAFLGNIYYYTQQLQKALVCFENALKNDPKLDYAKERIESLKKEISVEGKLTDTKYSIFRILYNSDNKKVDISAVQKALWEAYYDIGAQFQNYPQHTIVVILYSPAEFKTIRETPTWVAGIYDGKIRIPYPQGIEMAEVEKIIRHEYTHAILHEITDGKCANWLNEGLARLMESKTYGEDKPNYVQLKKAYKESALNNLETLSGNFIFTKDDKKAALAYQQSTALVTYIIDTYGFYKVRNMLKHFKDDKTLAEILKIEFYQTPDSFMTNFQIYLRDYLLK